MDLGVAARRQTAAFLPALFQMTALCQDAATGIHRERNLLSRSDSTTTFAIMKSLSLHEWHTRRNARFAEVNGMEVVAHYGDPRAEHTALQATAGLLDLSFRSRLSLTGADRHRLLNGQVTNNVKELKPGAGCYAAMLTAKGRVQCDLNVYARPDDLLLDLEPGLAESVAQRLDKFIIADDVQVTDLAPVFGLLSVQGPAAAKVMERLGCADLLPTTPLHFARVEDAEVGEFYVANHPRTGSAGFDCFVPAATLEIAAERILAAAATEGGRTCGWEALETARIEAGIPRYGADMDESNLPPEAGIEERAVSYTKGCYIGQEVVARLRTYGHVNKSLCGLRFENDLKCSPQKTDKLYRGDKEIGYVTSFVFSPTLNANIALGYVRREHLQSGSELTLRTADGDCTARIVTLPFLPELRQNE